ncbi:uracil phosphoribosyltransferase-domain-containing protein [Apiospora kogelbergensis]|uniref:Uracil phosphoribosyltransferase-domain-containing protein n=1 Tax=Apiospora kogelbergensis TaxID=1337665 RepID=A0AAW0QDN7_9PEZI
MASGKEDWEHAKAGFKRGFNKFITRKTRQLSDFTTGSSSGASTPAIEDEVEKAPGGGYKSVDDFIEQVGSYQYDAIPDKGYIRLLEIVPAPEEDWIETRLTSVSLEDSVRTYDALSYVWGDPDQPRKGITVNNCHFEVYESLFNALKSLRIDTGDQNPIVLWVDAICINQADVAERNSQVPIMDSIYRNARRTIVWLGSEEVKTERTFEMLRYLVEDSKTDAFKSSVGVFDAYQETMPLTLLQFFKAPRIQSPAIELYGNDGKIWKILACAWWHRSWTLQEILLSTDITFVMGRYKMDWQELCTAVDHGFRLRIWTFLEMGTFVNRDLLPYLTIRDLQRRLGLYSATDQSPQAERGPEILLTLLEGCRQRESKDPRDKIYAVSGILKNIQSRGSDTDAINRVKIDPDYASPVVYVYRMMSQQLISTTKTLDVLGISPKSSRRGLPSWVTDWSTSASMAVPLTRDSLDRPRRTHAARHTTATAVRFPEDAVTLVLRGHEVATVSEISSSIPRFDYRENTRLNEESSEAQQERLRAEAAARGEEEPTKWGLRGMVMRDLKTDMKNIFTDEAQHWHVLIQWERFGARRSPTNPSVYWKTLCAGTYDEEDPAATEALYEKWSRSLEVLRKNERRFGSAGYGMHPLAYLLQSSAWEEGFPEFSVYCECAIERRLAWCANGWLALLPDGARMGDRIVLAEGGRVPLVLRPDGDGYNTFVGEAYVHGIMNGEAFKQSQCHDIKIC